jgi:hypothetical protein
MYHIAIIIIILIIYFFINYNGLISGGAIIKREKSHKVEIDTDKKQIKLKVRLDRKKRKEEIKEITEDPNNYVIEEKYLKQFYNDYFNKKEIDFINNFNYTKNINELINLQDIPLNIKYRQTPQTDKIYSKFVTNIHRGQLKLLLCEIFYLTKIHKLEIVKPDSIVVYVGAGPGHHLLKLIELFPNFKYHLYDTRFDEKLKELSNVKLHLRFFTREDCEQYKDKNIIFISDIRHPSMGDYGEPSPKQNPIIIRDQKMQKEWVNIIKPYASLLKFRLPWLTDDQPYNYLNGQVFVQPYAPRNSTETRLLVTDPTSEKTYSCSEYENKMFFVNKVLRYKYAHRDNKPHDKTNYDYSYGLYICEYYADVLGYKIDSKKMFNDLLNSNL